MQHQVNRKDKQKEQIDSILIKQKTNGESLSDLYTKYLENISYKGFT